MTKKGYKQTEEHKKKIGLANSISLKGHSINENQKNGLEYGNKFNHTEEANKKRVETRKEKRNGKWLTEEEKKVTVENIKKGIKEKFPEGRPINSGNWKNGHKPWNKGLIGYNSGEKSNSWKGGISFEKYPREFNKYLKKEIKERDNYICQLCNIQLEKIRRIKINPNKNWATVHHIDYNKKNCSKKNLITLCHFCNISVNTEREQWTKFFKSKLSGE